MGRLEWRVVTGSLSVRNNGWLIEGMVSLRMGNARVEAGMVGCMDLGM